MNTEPENTPQKSISTYEVKGLHCGACVSKVEKTLSVYASQVTVTLDPPRAILENPQANLSELNQALTAAGDYRLGLIVNLSQPKPTAVESANVDEAAQTNWLITYQPLLLIVGYILMTTLAIQFASHDFDTHGFNTAVWMTHFMAGFFLVFSFFKLLNLKAFANSYAMYDLLAMRFKWYGLLYPFIELGLGIAYLMQWQPAIVHCITLIVMTFSSLGVIRAVSQRQKIRCACLGSVFNLPMSTITIIEDLLMAGMAAWMLLPPLH